MKSKSMLQFAALSLLGTVLLPAVPSDSKEVNPVEVGSTAPNVTLTKANGTKVELHNLVSGHPAVLVFYRGGWCPYCNRHLAALGEIEDELRALGYRIHAVSMDKPKKVQEAAAESDLSYTLYSDALSDAARAFGLAFKVDAETFEKLLGHGIDLEAASGQDHHILPVPAVFLIGRDARIDFRYYNPDYKERLSGEALLKAAQQNKPD